jgi:isoaspartyl peptidase/L-asparaginase-like protein (Ntn-hydrolase superfamily)
LRRKKMITRREFIAGTTGAAAGTILAGCLPGTSGKRSPENAMIPAIISTWESGKKANDVAARILLEGGNSLDAVEKGVNDAELDPVENSVGYGGLPNEDGQVELDAMIMHGPTHRVGAVAGLKNVALATSVARKVMEKTRHTFLVGAGALEFARKMKFKEQELLTPESKKRWEDWRKDPKRKQYWTHDTIGMVVVDAKGDISAACSTSGLEFKIGGRVGDSPIIGSGAYCDNDVGGAAATGNGDVMMRFCPTFLVVELMRQGLSPQEACEEALRRMLEKKVEANAALVAINKRGEFGAAKIGTWKLEYAVWNKKLNELRTIKNSVGDRK